MMGLIGPLIRKYAREGWTLRECIEGYRGECWIDEQVTRQLIESGEIAEPISWRIGRAVRRVGGAVAVLATFAGVLAVIAGAVMITAGSGSGSPDLATAGLLTAAAGFAVYRAGLHFTAFRYPG